MPGRNVLCRDKGTSKDTVAFFFLRFWIDEHLQTMNILIYIIKPCQLIEQQLGPKLFFGCPKTPDVKSPCFFHFFWGGSTDQPSVWSKEHLHLVLGTLQRDLKPRNVVFSRSGRAKLTDFGMGRIGGTAVTFFR